MSGARADRRPSRLRYPSVKSYHSIRTAHLERALAAPASFVCRTFRYDLDQELSGRVDVHQVGTVRRLWLLATSDIATAEVNEPLMRHALPFTASSIVALRLNGAARRRRIAIGTYAIENLDPFRDADTGRWRRRVRRRAEWWLARRVTRQIDRLAFGTADAHRLYDAVLGGQLRHVRTTDIPALPAPCDCPETPRQHNRLLFVGALDDRKGIRQLMQAWPEIACREPSATFVIVGKGPLENEVREFADVDPSVSFLCDPPRDEVHRALRAASVLALLSQEAKGWREQVGLPIVEGLAHGCRIVTTDQTGLASWLVDHGHDVVGPDSPPTTVAAAVNEAFRRPTGAAVLAQLPATDGRLAADTWLRSGLDHD